MKLPATLLAALLLTACGSQVVEPSYYLLRSGSDLDSRALQPAVDYALGSISVAPYIDQPGLLLETAAGEIRPARQHLWAEPINDSLRSFLIEEISRRAGSDLLPIAAADDAARINVRIDQLHGTRDGRARLVAYWWLQRGNGVENAHRFAQERSLERDGYAALVDAQRALLSALAGDIAGNL